MTTIPPNAGGGGQASGGGGSPPMGSVPATQGTPNAGTEVQGLAALRVLVNMAAHILPLVGPTTEAGQALTKVITSLGKFVPPGAVNQAAEGNMLDNLQRRQMQAGPQVAALRGAPPAQAA